MEKSCEVALKDFDTRRHIVGDDAMPEFPECPGTRRSNTTATYEAKAMMQLHTTEATWQLIGNLEGASDARCDRE